MMITGLLTTWLSVALGALPADVVPMKDRNFQLPIRSIDAARRGELRELVLYYSTDEGRSWKRYTSVPPDSKAFIVNLPQDGTYWFNVCVVDRQGTQEPSDPSKVAPAQKIVIDTVKPLLRVTSAVRQGDQIVVAWDIQEENPDLPTLKMEYRTPEMPASQWETVSLNPAQSGQVSFRPPGSGFVSIRMQMQDLAGNSGSTFADVPAASPLAASSSSLPSGALSSMPPPAPISPPDLQHGFASSTVSRSDASTPMPTLPSTAPAPSVQQTNLVSPTLSRTTVDGAGWSSAPASTPAAQPAPLSGGALPALQVVNVQHIPIEYQVDKQGPSKIGKAELYVTADDGKSWRKCGEDAAPHLLDEPNSTAQMMADVPSEGIYGFSIVVQSRAGLAKRPPMPGDAPEIRVEVDTTRPEVTLYPPEADPDHQNSLVLKWKAFDRNLHAAPITLQWSAGRDGPWMTIASDLANTGRYSWQLPSAVPVRVYLRLSAKDTAGNVGEVTTPEPVLVDVVEPAAHIRGIALQAARRP
jgi:hypothetical protein